MRQQQSPMRKLIWCAVALALVLVLVVPQMAQQVEGAKKKEKKLLKELIKGLIFKNLSTRKNFLPLPVPIPVPIELDEPPVYLKGKPRYVTVYKSEPPMPVYTPPAYHYPMMQSHYEEPSYDYSQMMSPHSSFNYGTKHLGDGSSVNFNDFDDDPNGYYVRKSAKKSGDKKKSSAYSAESGSGAQKKGSSKDEDSSKRIDRRMIGASMMGAEDWLMSMDEQESIDHDETQAHRRMKRQAYQPPSHDYEPPCYGFPLEINIKSRIKMDQVFPIQGKSQVKKCIKFT